MHVVVVNIISSIFLSCFLSFSLDSLFLFSFPYSSFPFLSSFIIFYLSWSETSYVRNTDVRFHYFFRFLHFLLLCTEFSFTFLYVLFSYPPFFSLYNCFLYIILYSLPFFYFPFCLYIFPLSVASFLLCTRSSLYPSAATTISIRGGACEWLIRHSINSNTGNRRRRWGRDGGGQSDSDPNYCLTWETHLSIATWCSDSPSFLLVPGRDR